MNANPELPHNELPKILLVLAAFATVPLWITAVGLYPYLPVEIVIWCIFAMGYNLALGYTGLPSFGHGAFLGIGGYAFGLAQFNLHPNLWLCLAAAIVAGMVAGALVAVFISHRRGIYYALLTIAFGEVYFFIATKWHDVTGGEDGLLNIRRLPAEFGFFSVRLDDNWTLFYFVLALFAIVIAGLWRLTRSRFGTVIQAINQNDRRAAAIGYNVWVYKFLVFALSSGVAGLAGALLAMAQQGAYVQVMSLQWSGIVVLMTLIGGGLVSFWGPVLGTIVFFLARDVLGAATETWLLWYGLSFMLIIMFKPEGIAGILQDLGRRMERPRPVQARSSGLQ